MNDKRKVYLFITIKGIIHQQLLESFKNRLNIMVFILHAILCLLFYTEMWRSIFLMKCFQYLKS